MTKMKTSGRIQPRISGSHRLTNSPVYFTPVASRSSSSFGSSILVVLKFLLPSASRFRVPRMGCSTTYASASGPARTAVLNSLEESCRPVGARNHVWTRMSSRSPPRKYQIGPPARPLVRSERRSPGRLSRGFSPEPPLRIARWGGRPGGVRRFANIPSSSHRLLLLELQFIVTHIDQDRVALADVPLQYPHGQRIQHAALNRPLQRPGAEHRIEAFGHEEAASRIGQLDVHPPLLEPP